MKGKTMDWEGARALRFESLVRDLP